MRTALCVIVALWLPPASLGAQALSPPPRRLSLPEARALAQRHSPSLRAARHGLEVAAGRERQAGGFPNPILSYSREQTSRAGDANTQDILSLEQPLEIGGQRGARRKAAGLTRAAAEARLAATAARIDYEVALSYATAIAAERHAALAQEAATAFGLAARVSQARLAGGDVSGYQDRRLALEAGRYGALQLQALMARDSAVLTLASLVGLADSSEVVGVIALVDTLMPAPLTVPVDSLVARGLVRRAELRAAGLDAEAGAAEARLVRSERIPTPVLIGGYKHERLATGETLGGFVAGVSLPLPFWDRGGGAVASARSEAARRDAEVEALRRQTSREVRTAFEAHQTLAGQLSLLAGQLGEGASKARRAAEAAYAEGEISQLEWLDSVRAYQEAEATYATLRADYIARRAALERATGATLF